MSASSKQRSTETDGKAEDGPDVGRGGSREGYLPGWARHWWPSLQRRSGGDDGPTADETAEEDDGLLGGPLITLLIVGGAILFVFPEPITSVLGVLAVTAGVVAFVYDWAT